MVQEALEVIQRLGQHSAPGIQLEIQRVVKGALGALDLRTEDSLLPNVHGDEEI